MAALRMNQEKKEKRTFEDFYGAEMEALEVAYNRFNNISERYVEPELVEAAMLELKAAELKMEVAARQAKAAAKVAAAEAPAGEGKKKGAAAQERRAGRTGSDGILNSLAAVYKGFFSASTGFPGERYGEDRETPHSHLGDHNAPMM